MITVKQLVKDNVSQQDFGIPSDINKNIEYYVNYLVYIKTESLRTAAQMALEALERSTKHFNIVRLHESSLADTEVRCNAHEAMNALRKELS